MCESQGTALKNAWQSQEAKNTEVVLKKMEQYTPDSAAII